MNPIAMKARTEPVVEAMESPSQPNRPASALRPTEHALRPKEHGAYAILGIPLVTALIAAGPTTAGIAVAVAACAGFLAHEPLLVTLGHRGSRAQRISPAALRRLTVLLALMILGGSVALLTGSHAVRWSLLACAVCAAVSFWLAFRGKHRTLAGQLWGVVGLSAPCVPVLLSGTYATATAIAAWASLLIGFTSTTIAVRGVIAAQKRQPTALHLSILGIATLLACALRVSGMTMVVAALPMLALSWYLLLRPPPARYLKRIGWTLVAGTLGTSTWLLLLI